MHANEFIRKAVVFLLYASLAIPFFVANSLLFPFISGKGFAFRIIVEVALALWVALAARDARYRPNWRSPVLLAGGTFLLVVLIADSFGADPYFSLWSNYERMDGFVLLAHVGAYALVMSSVFKTAGDWRRFLVGWLVAAAGMAVFAFTQILGLQKINQGASRVDGTLGNATYLAGMMLFAVGFAAAVAIGARERWARNAALAVGAAAAVAMVYSGTRGAVLGLAAGVLFAGVLFLVVGRGNEYRRLGWWVVGGFAALALVAVAAFQFPAFRQHPAFGRLADVSLQDKTILSRVINAEIAWQGFLERPVLGWGQGNYSQVFDSHYDPRMHDQEQYFDRTHSILTDWLVAAGALGWLAYFALLGLVAWAIWRAEPLSRGERVALLATLAAYLVHNVFVFDNLVSYMQYAALIAAAAALGPSLPSRRLVLGRDTANLAAAVAVLALPVAIYFVNVPAIAAGRDTIRGIQLVGVDRKTGEPALVYPSVDYNRKFFEDAIAENSFGTPEATQQFVSTAGSVLSISNLPAESKERFLASAEKAILSLVAARPDDSRVRALAGNFYGRLQLYSQAIEHLEAGVALAPRKQSVRIPLAATYFAQGQTERAVAFAGETYDINHNNDSAWLALVRLAARLPDSATFDALIAEAQAEGRHDRVVSYAELSVSSNPGEPQNRAALAKALADAGRHDDAVAVLETAKADFPKLASQFDAMIVQIETLKKAN